MKENTSKSYVFVMILGVMCLALIVISASYAYFTSGINGQSAPIGVSTGDVNLSISENKIDVSSFAPIREENKETKALNNNFTITRTDNSTLDACYTLYLDVDRIGDNLKNEWFKYELLDKSGNLLKSGDFSSLTYDENGKSRIMFVQNQSLSSSNTSNTYTLRLWLAHSDTVDQTFILQGNEDARTFEGHLYANGLSVKCSNN